MWADFFRELGEKTIALHIEHGSKLPTPLAAMYIHAINGATQRLGGHDTAFRFRDASFVEVIYGIDDDPANLFHVNQNIEPSV